MSKTITTARRTGDMRQAHFRHERATPAQGHMRYLMAQKLLSAALTPALVRDHGRVLASAGALWVAGGYGGLRL
jgi:hypothetical protein